MARPAGRRLRKVSSNAVSPERTRPRVCHRGMSLVALRGITVLVSASGAPGTAALLRALRENGEREVRLVGTDMSERSVGRHLCDAFHVVPEGSSPDFPDAMRQVAEQEQADAILPQSSFDLEGLAGAVDRFEDVPVLVS